LGYHPRKPAAWIYRTDWGYRLGSFIIPLLCLWVGI
jgi:hypothetical protein